MEAVALPHDRIEAVVVEIVTHENISDTFGFQFVPALLMVVLGLEKTASRFGHQSGLIGLHRSNLPGERGGVHGHHEPADRRNGHHGDDDPHQCDTALPRMPMGQTGGRVTLFTAVAMTVMAHAETECYTVHRGGPGCPPV